MQIKSWKKEKVPKMTHPLKRRGSNFWVYFTIQGVLEVSNLGVHSPQWCTVRNLPPNTWATQYKHHCINLELHGFWDIKIRVCTYLKLHKYTDFEISKSVYVSQVTVCVLVHKQRTGITGLTHFLCQPKTVLGKIPAMRSQLLSLESILKPLIFPTFLINC